MTQGNAEPIPEYWTVIQVAKYLGCKPWELIEQPRYWLSAGIICINAENEVKEKQQKKQQQAAKRGRG